MTFKRSLILLAAVCALAGCNNPADSAPAADGTSPAQQDAATLSSQPGNPTPFEVTEVARFDNPWAMTFLPDGRLLVTEMAGNLKLYDPASGATGTVSGVPQVKHAGQGGLGDVVLHPRFGQNSLVYLSYVEADKGISGGVVARARLSLDDNGGGTLEDLQVIWRQIPKTRGDGHFSYRIAFDTEGKLWISSGERREADPAQALDSNLGKTIRLHENGSPPADNPFADQGEVAAEVWSLGHRNILGMAFDAEGRLWAHEMGPRGGDELNLIVKGGNYGYPVVSEGRHYSGLPIPNHDTRPDFMPPVVSWTPVISPAGFIIYDGELFPGWRGSGFIGGLSSRSLVRIAFEGESAYEAERFDMQRRIREVEQGPDGAIWLLEDGKRGSGGALLKLVPRSQ